MYIYIYIYMCICITHIAVVGAKRHQTYKPGAPCRPNIATSRGYIIL